MCFTPTISLTTAIIEFIVAAFLLFFRRKSLINRFSAVFIFMLGFYQFTEFMLCTSGSPALWAKIGFITYTFLPAAAMHVALKWIRAKTRPWWIFLIYASPVIFASIAILKEGFVVQSTCNTFFVTVRTLLFYTPGTIVPLLYGAYYLGFILLISFVLLNQFRNEKNRLKRMIDFVIFCSIMASLVPALILFIAIPAMKLQFPSVYCEFAVLFTIGALVASGIEEKIAEKKSSTIKNRKV